MKYQSMRILVPLSVAAITLAACAGSAGPTPTPAAVAAQPTVAVQPTALPTSDAAALLNQALRGITGAGEVMATQDADLNFQTQGIVEQVLVEEGQSVKFGDLLAVLDVRTLDQQVLQAEAGLANAQAQQAALTEDPKVADLAAAQAGVRQAQAALDQVRAGAKSQDLDSVDAGVKLAEVNLQSTRDRLSFAKTQADLQVETTAFALTQAQARYAQSKYNYEFARDTGNDPIVPTLRDATGRARDNKLSDGQLENYYAQFVQAEAALKQAEKTTELAVKSAEIARQAEITGIAAAEQQVIQAQKGAEKLRLPADKDRIAAAEAALAQARANQARLKPDPRKSQEAQAAAGIASAEAQLTLAKINRERAELRAPFAGIVSIINIDPGDGSVVQGGAAVRIVDVSTLRVEVQISDVDIARVSVGAVTQITVDGLPGKTFTGKVSYIAPTTTSNTSAIRTYLVKVALDDQTSLRAGMNARVNIAE